MLTRFQKISLLIIIIMFISFVSGLFFGYFQVIKNQKITQDNNYYYVEFMGHEFYYDK
jgi:hypothetical protein